MRKELLTRAPYYLLVRTTQYTGNFERELAGYLTGMVDDDMHESDGYHIHEEYCIEFYEEDMKGNPIVQDTILNKYLYKESRHENWGLTFFDVTSHPSNEKWNCDSWFMMLQEPLGKDNIFNFDYERFIIERIKKFFQDTRIAEKKEEYQLADGTHYFYNYSSAAEADLISIELYETGKEKPIKVYKV